MSNRSWRVAWGGSGEIKRQLVHAGSGERRREPQLGQTWEPSGQVGGGKVGAFAMTTPNPNIDPDKVEQSLKHKRRKWRKRKLEDTAENDEPSPVIVADNLDQDWEEIQVVQPDPPIQIAHSSSHVYRWVVVMEHQRGFTFFNTPHYSTASLLPNDPPPFQVLDSSHDQPWSISTIDDYTLPSPLWQWISRYWMVDMRGDGDVDSNGWQYNHSFNSNTWKAHVRSFNRGGWVRRRRWVRLMTKLNPTEKPLKNGQDRLAQSSADPSIVWKGDSDDWGRCRRALKTKSTDGLKVELWRSWILDESVASIALNHVIIHLDEIVSSFVYPDTRRQFLMLIRDRIPNDIALSKWSTDFWSKI